MKLFLIAVVGIAFGMTGVAADGNADSAGKPSSERLKFTADRIAVDITTHATHATGHIHAVSHPVTMRGESLVRNADGSYFFAYPTCVTTCTNDVGHTHWSITGELDYRDDERVIMRHVWLRLFEVPIFYLPYMYYPLNNDCGFSWMPGYIGSWKTYLLMKYGYHLLGDRDHSEVEPWLSGATHFDLRERQGVALGEDLNWGLGKLGMGKFRMYYAWDQSVEDMYGRPVYSSDWDSGIWGSNVEEQRYAFEFSHRWEVTERDTLRVHGGYYSDSYFRNDFMRRTMFNSKSQWLGYEGNGVFWEHVENSFAIGGEASGRLNDFYGTVGRLPEFYIDVQPQPLFGLPVNYESENRIGYMTRNPSEYGSGGSRNPFRYNPGPWADYATFRLDTYHRLTLPFRTLDDTMSVVPRVGYRGTYWQHSGVVDVDGWYPADEKSSLFRSIIEGGVTFAGRGTAMVNDTWLHAIEPYLDALAQHAYFAGAGGSRPYVFDNIDSTQIWEDQFAGRGRSLPYTYYGVTPGLRNAWSKLDDRGHLSQIVDFDVYAALQFNAADYLGYDSSHRLADRDSSPYAENDCSVAPGARLRWTPTDAVTLMTRAEYDSDNNRLSLADIGFRQVVSSDFDYDVRYAMRNYRYWDFGLSPVDSTQVSSDEFNYVRLNSIMLKFTHHPIDWLAWSPFLNWDVRDNSLDCVGAWIDLLTDCLGFRFSVQYNNEYTDISGYRRDDDWSFGFFIYLRAFGPEASTVFAN